MAPAPAPPGHHGLCGRRTGCCGCPPVLTGSRGCAHLLGGALQLPSQRGCRPWPAASPHPHPRYPCRGRQVRSSRSGVGPVLAVRGAVAWGRRAAPAGSAPAPAPCHQEHLWGQGQGWGTHPLQFPKAEVGPWHLQPTPPILQSKAPNQGQPRLSPKQSLYAAPPRHPKRKGWRSQQFSLQCPFSPSMWIDFSSPSSSTSTRSRPFSTILQTDKQTDGRSRAMQPMQHSRKLQGQRPADGGKSVGARWAGTALTSWW